MMQLFSPTHCRKREVYPVSSFMSEIKLRTRSKICSHFKKEIIFLVSEGHKYISSTNRAINEQVQHWVPLITYKKIATAVNIVEHQKTVNIEKKLENGLIGFLKQIKKYFVTTCKKNNLEDGQEVQVKLDCF